MAITGSQYTINFIAEATANPFVNANWVSTTDTMQNTNGAGQGLRPSSVGVFAEIHFTGIVSASLIKAKMAVTSNISVGFGDVLGLAIVDAVSGEGYIFTCNGSSGSIRKRTTGSGIGSSLGSFTLDVTPGVEYEFWYDTASGDLTVLENEVVVSTQNDTDYQASTFAIGILGDPQNNNGRRVGAFGADYSTSGVIISGPPTEIFMTEPTVVQVIVSSTPLTTANTEVFLDSNSNPPIIPSAVVLVEDTTYDITFAVPDEYADLPYSLVGYDLNVTTPDGDAESGSIPYLPATGNAYQTISSVPGVFEILSGNPIKVGGQIEYQTLGGTVTVTSDLQIIYTGENPAGLSFWARVWDPDEFFWGEWALQTLTGGSPPIPSTNLDKRFLMDFLYPSAVAAKPLGYQQITDLSSAQGLTVPSGTCFVLFKPTGQAIRFRDDGTDPTASVGYPVATGYEYVYTGSSPSALSIIEVTSGAILDVLYYGRA